MANNKKAPKNPVVKQVITEVNTAAEVLAATATPSPKKTKVSKRKPAKKKPAKKRKQASKAGKQAKAQVQAAPAHINRLANTSDKRKVTRILKSTGNAHAAKHAAAIAATRNPELVAEIMKQK